MKYLFVFMMVGITGLVNAQTETAKQPHCNEVEGLQIGPPYIIPANYTGVVKQCKDGKVKSLNHYKDGKQEGLSRTWYENGQLRSEEGMKYDVRDGWQRTWYKSGQLWSEQHVVADPLGYKVGFYQDGPERYWHENGQLESEEFYEEDGHIGISRGWYENGQLRWEQNWKQRDLNGKWTCRKWHKNGQLRTKANLLDSKVLEVICWDEKGNKIECTGREEMYIHYVQELKYN